jgi:putative transposase
MAYRVTQRIISSDDLLYPYFDDLCRKSKLLYNAALFRVRNIFTGYDKEHRTENEVEVFQEVALLQRSYPNMHVRRVISYTHLEKMMRVTENADFFSGLPRQTAQQMVKQSVTDFKNWLASLREYKKHPEKYLGKPKMPRYKKSDLTTVIITNQDAVLYRDDIGMSLKLPLQKQRLYFSNLSSDPVLKEVKIKPYYGRFLLCLTLEEPDVAFDPSGSHVCAIDLGTDNFAAIVCDDHSSAIYKGGAVLSKIQWFHKQRAKYVSIITKGHEKKHAVSKRLRDLSFHYANFVSMPITLLRTMITYKALNAGIRIIEQEESYTSKADLIANDRIPTYGVDDKDASFSGKRIKRGLYRCSNGMILNADCHAAANIMRKAIPDIWKDTRDYTFLSAPDVYGFHKLNPKGIPVKGIAA